MEFFNYDAINWLAILVGALAYMFVGGLWYGPVAGKAWMEEMGITPEDLEGQSPAPAMIKSTISALVFSFGLALVIYNPVLAISGWQEGAMIGIFVALIFVGAGAYPNYAFESKALRHFLIHIGCSSVGMALIGAIMGAWK
ncbi:DUF1761 domain-containing protein [Temperatibacter marinus]|uniref:DUF1761 domain-containing protein n=1 Tax=Temperatibacter marinus TaxID=1456591 RepID=A0AA52H912_9PROT|nr:DUF1761 domain-containing protein [Temperatibacter marinus]WND02394.1 DUF1761 domain-containing protein [Temperatibacter marinus]